MERWKEKWKRRKEVDAQRRGKGSVIVYDEYGRCRVITIVSRRHEGKLRASSVQEGLAKCCSSSLPKRISFKELCRGGSNSREKQTPPTEVDGETKTPRPIICVSP